MPYPPVSFLILAECKTNRRLVLIWTMSTFIVVDIDVDGSLQNLILGSVRNYVSPGKFVWAVTLS